MPSVAEEQDALWEMTADLSGLDNLNENITDKSPEDYLPHPKNYKNWFSFYDEIDLRRHLQDVEIVLIEEALEITNGKIALSADKLKLRRTTLIEKMKKYSIEFRRGNAGGGNQLRQPYLKEYVSKIKYSKFPIVEHVHNFGYYIGNYPELKKNKILKICKILNSIHE